MVTTTIGSDHIAAPAESHVYVVDDDIEMRKSLHFLLSTMAIRSWPFGSGEDFFQQLPFLELAPILLDIRMAGMDGFEVLNELAARKVNWPIIVMTAHGDIAIAVRAMKLGAIEFLEKPFEPDALEAALARGFAIGTEIRAAAARQAVARGQLETLTDRERQVLDGLIEGASNKIIAYRLGLSVRTVEMHRGNAMGKLKLKSVAEAVALMGLV